MASCLRPGCVMFSVSSQFLTATLPIDASNRNVPPDCATGTALRDSKVKI